MSRIGLGARRAAAPRTCRGCRTCRVCRDPESVARSDTGSATPLVLGMVLCLLLLSVGVIAAGSVVLAKQNLQSACDAAASAVAGQLTPDQLDGAPPTDLNARLATELHRRRAGAEVTGTTAELSVRARCQARSSVAFGALFGSPTLNVSVDAVGNLTRS